LPGQDHLRRDVTDASIADVGADVVVRVLAVVEAGLECQVLVGIDPVEVEIEELRELESRRRRSILARTSRRSRAASAMVANPRRVT
jgi:hypothetical protein